ncbi:hypothetical protein [Clostridium sp. KNHs216]|nr:hypothetical protein [Clostridium sp. KNHs216]
MKEEESLGVPSKCILTVIAEIAAQPMIASSPNEELATTVIHLS